MWHVGVLLLCLSYIAMVQCTTVGTTLSHTSTKDPTLDAWCTATGTLQIATSSIHIHEQAGFIFDGINVPVGMKIIEAYIDFKSKGSTGKDMFVVCVVHNVSR